MSSYIFRVFNLPKLMKFLKIWMSLTSLHCYGSEFDKSSSKLSLFNVPQISSFFIYGDDRFFQDDYKTKSVVLSVRFGNTAFIVCGYQGNKFHHLSTLVVFLALKYRYRLLSSLTL